MCQTVIIDETKLETVDELRAALFPCKLLHDARFYGPRLEGRWCLCCIDLVDAAAKLGRVPCRRDGGDPTEVHLVKAGDATGEFIALDDAGL